MNKIARLCMQNKTFRDNYFKSIPLLNPDENKVTVTFLKKKEEKLPTNNDDPLSDEMMINLFMEWLDNQRRPESEDHD